MATRGSLIEQASFSKSWASHFHDSHDTEGKAKYVHINAAAWRLEICGTDGILSDTEVWADIFYWDGRDWQAFRRLKSNGNPKAGLTFNCPCAEYDNITTQYPIWSVRYVYFNGKSKHWYIDVLAGGYGLMPHASLYTKRIYSIGQSGGTDRNIYSTGFEPGGTPISGDIASVFNYSNRSGAPIMASMDNELVSYPYL